MSTVRSAILATAQFLGVDFI